MGGRFIRCNTLRLVLLRYYHDDLQDGLMSGKLVLWGVCLGFYRASTVRHNQRFQLVSAARNSCQAKHMLKVCLEDWYGPFLYVGASPGALRSRYIGRVSTD